MDPNQRDENWVLLRKDGKAQVIWPGMMFVGREECDIILQSASADKRHAVLFFDAKKRELHIKDLNSLTGTYVNGIKIPEQTYMKLKPLDNLRFGYGPDVFRIQSCQLVSRQATTPPKEMDKNVSVIPSPTENRESSRNGFSSMTKSQTSNTKTTSNLQDSLEDLKQQSSGAESAQTKSLEMSSSEHPSVSPSFSSLTFKRSNTRVLCSPSEQNSLSSSFSQENDSLPEDKLKNLPSSSYPSTSPNTLDSSLCSSLTTDPSASLQPASEKENAAESAPPAMAFTVAFDNPTPKKKFSIRDSISKYAPKKAETERAARQKIAKSTDNLNKKPEPPVPEVHQVELRKKKSPEYVTKDYRSSVNRSTREDLTAEPKLTNGATYLIQKMFREDKRRNLDVSLLSNDVKPQPQEEVRKPSPPASSPVKDCRNEDSKSDTGTYTVDDDLNNKVVEEARQRIDEVFGISGASNLNTSADSKMLPEKDIYQQQLKQDESLKSSSTSLSESKDSKQPVIAPIRTKRRLPTPPIQAPVEQSNQMPNEKPYLSVCSAYAAKGRPQTMLPVVPKENEKSSLPSKRLTMNNLEMLQNACANTQLVLNGHPDYSRRTPPYANRHRSPWNLSGSDMELDHMKIETSSVLSDVSASTEPPMNPGNGKSDAGPQMKFNRAFALRRARLGLETELPPPSKSLVSRDLKQSKETLRRSAAPTSFSRQDGGRFSLRLPKSSSKPVVNKPVSKSQTKAATAGAAQRVGHNQTNSDLSSKATFLMKRGNQVPCGSDSKLKGVSRPSFQRAASFSNSDESNLNVSSPPQHPRSYQLKQHDRHSLTAARSSPRSSPVTSVKDSTDELYNKESRASPRPTEKAELSALDSLVIQATHQLSAKLRNIAHHLLVKERDKFTEDSSERLMIDEVLPTVLESENNPCASCSDRGVSQELANTLKNLKRVEQSLKVLSVVVDEERMDPRRLHHHHNHRPETEDSYYVVNI